jgi:hypothetical protein
VFEQDSLFLQPVCPVPVTAMLIPTNPVIAPPESATVNSHTKAKTAKNALLISTETPCKAKQHDLKKIFFSLFPKTIISHFHFPLYFDIRITNVQLKFYMTSKFKTKIQF